MTFIHPKAELVGVTVFVTLCGISNYIETSESLMFPHNMLSLYSAFHSPTLLKCQELKYSSYISKSPTSPFIPYQSIQLSSCRLWSIGTIAQVVTCRLSHCVQSPIFPEVLIMLTTRSVVRTRPTWASDHAYIILLFAPQHFLGRQPAWGNSHFSTACSHGTSLTFKLTWKPFSE